MPPQISRTLSYIGLSEEVTMKRFLAVFMAVMMVFTFASCQNEIPVTRYSVTVVSEGSADATVEMNEGDSFELPVQNERKLHDFLGYKDGDGTVYQAGESVKITKDMKFTAIWQKAAAWDGTATSKEDIDKKVVEDGDNYRIEIDNAEDFAGIMANANKYGNGKHATLTIELKNSLDLAGHDWTPAAIDGYNDPCGKVILEGNGYTIWNLQVNSDSNAGLFASTWAGKSSLEIRDLTIRDAVINGPEESSTNGVGAFIGYTQASSEVSIINCHLIDSKVAGGHWTGGFIGAAAGYSGNDGPVFQTVRIEGSSIKGTSVIAKGSVGGFVGHATQDPWTDFYIKDSSAENIIVTSTGSSDNKAGSIMGTVGAAGTEKTANGETRTGGVHVDGVTVKNAAVKSNATEIDRIYGRQGTTTGKLYVDGVEIQF